MPRFNFLLVFGAEALSEKTKFTRNGQPFAIEDDKALAKLIYRLWKKQTASKSFQDWADELNADPDYEGGFTKEDALDNLTSNFVLNQNGRHVPLYEFIKTNIPELL